MQAIETKYLPATNTRRSRIKATTASGISVTVAHDYEFSGVMSHWRAAKALAGKLGWAGRWQAAGTRSGYVFVRVEYSDGGPVGGPVLKVSA